MSKFMFHIRFSDSDTFLHEHEAFEMMRSRNLYQVQFELKRKLHKRIRSLEMAEKMHANAYHNRRAFFLTKMQERVRLRKKINEGKEKFYDNQKQNEIILNGLFPKINDSNRTGLLTTQPNDTLHQITEMGDENANNDVSRENDSTDGALPPLVEKKETTADPEENEPVSTRVCFAYGGKSLGGIRSGLRLNTNYENKFHDEVVGSSNDDARIENNSEEAKNSYIERGDTLIRDDNRFENLTSKSYTPTKLVSTKKDKQVSSVSFVSEDTKFSCIGDVTGSNRELTRSREPRGSIVFLNDKFRKSQTSSTFFSDKSRCDDMPIVKQLTTYEMGVSTPEGELILSKDDYDRYMDKFRKATEWRLLLSRKRSENLEQKIREFRVAKPNIIKEY